MSKGFECTSCKKNFEAKDHYCFACHGSLASHKEKLKGRVLELEAQLLGQSYQVKKLLKANSELIQTAMPLTFLDTRGKGH